jgi:hypothetical protein
MVRPALVRSIEDLLTVLRPEERIRLYVRPFEEQCGFSLAVGLPGRCDHPSVYGVLYMSATADEHFELTLRGFSPSAPEGNR